MEKHQDFSACIEVRWADVYDLNAMEDVDEFVFGFDDLQAFGVFSDVFNVVEIDFPFDCVVHEA